MVAMVGYGAGLVLTVILLRRLMLRARRRQNKKVVEFGSSWKEFQKL